MAPQAARPIFTGYPFTVGVASGAPSPTGVVLWTRLPADPLHGCGVGRDRVRVQWEVADDETFAHVVRHGTAEARPSAAHTVHVEVDGLEPDRWYAYRFHAGAEDSPVGRTRTAPASTADVASMRFAFG